MPMASHDVSLFSWYLHKSLLAVNDVEELRFRVMGGTPVIFEEVHASATIGRKDGTFGFSFVPFDRDFATFNSSLKKEILFMVPSKLMVVQFAIYRMLPNCHYF